ncbi:MAG: phage tail assembly protein [Anaerolineae bacterium]|nr:phage tail assembly protein [Anaerolineae bacterium]
MMQALPQFEFPFELPRGYVDAYGVVHREGVMRLATAMDEITPLRDPRVRANEAYLVVVLLSQVITRLGSLPRVTPEMVESFFAADLAYLQDLYQQLNDPQAGFLTVVCPNCGHEFDEEIPLPGGS